MVKTAGDNNNTGAINDPSVNIPNRPDLGMDFPIFDMYDGTLISSNPIYMYSGPGRTGGPTNLQAWLRLAAFRSFFGDEDEEKRNRKRNTE
jgi:hypothetical protein